MDESRVRLLLIKKVYRPCVPWRTIWPGCRNRLEASPHPDAVTNRGLPCISSGSPVLADSNSTARSDPARPGRKAVDNVIASRLVKQERLFQITKCFSHRCTNSKNSVSIQPFRPVHILQPQRHHQIPRTSLLIEVHPEHLFFRYGYRRRFASREYLDDR